MSARATLMGMGSIAAILQGPLRDVGPPSATFAYASITLQASWVDHDTANWGAAAAGRGPGGLVVLRGLIRDGTGTAGTVIGVLPSGRRPAYSQMFRAAAPNTSGVDLTISTDGNITLFTAYSGSYLSLSGINFTVP